MSILGLSPVFGIPGWLVLLVCGLTALHFYFSHIYGFFRRRGVVYKEAWPLVGSALPIIFQSDSFSGFLQNIYRQFEGYSICGLFMFLSPMYMVRDLDLIKEITVKDFDYFTDHLGFIPDTDPLFGRSLLLKKGQKWRELRNILTPAFTSSKIKGMFTLAAKCGDQLVNYIDKLVTDYEKKGELLQVDAKDLFTRFTNDVIATSAFGIHCDSLSNPDNEFYTMGRAATTVGITNLVKTFLYIVFPGLMKFFKVETLPSKISNFFRKLVKEAIEIRETKGIIRPDLIHLLMQARKGLLTSDDDKDNPSRSKKLDLSLDDMTAQAFIFFFGGFESTSNTICFMTRLIADHPKVQQRLITEIDEVLHNHNDQMTYDAIQDMKYLDMVLSETLRKFPMTQLDRQATKDYQIKNIDKIKSLTIEKGMSILIPVFALHNDPKYFPDPEKFDPERFSEENKYNILPYSYLPFGVGPRNCIGNRFALMEVKLAVATILSQFSIKKVPKSPKELVIKKSFDFTIDGGFWLGFERRNRS